MMEKLCKNCKYWVLPKDGEYFDADDLVMPKDPDNEGEYLRTDSSQREQTGHVVRYCVSKKVKKFVRPDADGCSVIDAYDYMAVMITGENFGCVNFEEK